MAKIWQVIGTLAITSMIVFHYYTPIVTSPNSHLFSTQGDGLKAYFSAMYHIAHDEGEVHTTSMNYPYGESIFFLDSNPILTKVFRFAGIHQNHFVGTNNLLMLMMIPLTALFLFLIAIEMNMQWWIACLAAISLALLNPTIMRFTGHYTLAYSWFIPAAIWLGLRSYNKKSLWVLALFFMLACIAYFIHPYLGMIMTTFITALVIGHSINWNLKSFKHTALPILTAAFLPLIIFFFVVRLTDSHVGRVDNPYGFMVYKAHLSDLFIPSIGPVRHYLSKIVSLPHPNWEGLSYLGLPIIIIWLVMLLKKRLNIFKNWSPNIKNLLFAAFLVYLYAACVPFVFGLEFLVDYIPIIKSFRATARFVWPFYFVIGLLGFYMLQELELKPQIRAILVVFASVVLLWEANDFHNYLGNKLSQNPNQFLIENLDPELNKIVNEFSDQEFDAILPFPYYSHGTDNFVIEDHSSAKFGSMLLAYHMAKPIAAIAGARTSIPESRETISQLFQFFSDQQSTNNKKFLLLFDEASELRYPESLFATICEKPEGVKRFWSCIVSGREWSGAYFTSASIANDSSYSDPLLYLPYNRGYAELGYIQKGCKEVPQATKDTLFNYTVNKQSQSLDLSFWVLNNNQIKWGQDYFIGNNAKLYVNGTRIQEFKIGSSKIVDHDWSQVYFKAIELNQNDSIQLVLETKWEIPTGKLYIDDLLIKESDKNYRNENTINGFRFRSVR